MENIVNKFLQSHLEAGTTVDIDKQRLVPQYCFSHSRNKERMPMPRGKSVVKDPPEHVAFIWVDIVVAPKQEKSFQSSASFSYRYQLLELDRKMDTLRQQIHPIFVSSFSLIFSADNFKSQRLERLFAFVERFAQKLIAIVLFPPKHEGG